MPKYYAVKKGRKTGIFSTWPEAQAQVKGFSGALYKSFTTKEEATAFIEGAKKKPSQSDENLLVAYVDGSFDKVRGVYGSGIVLKKQDTVLAELSIRGTNDLFNESYQIAGEVIGSLEAISWGIANHYPAIEVRYDYEGIEKWALGYWKANKPVSKYYIEQFKELSKKIDVTFTKVKAHSGDKYNDIADELAKKATKLEKSEA